MSFVGEAAISVFLELLMGKLVDSALDFVADHKQVLPQLKQWQSILPGIQSVLNDAEQKQIKDEGVKNWLDDLQDLAYDVDDILDKFAYDVELRNTRAQASTSKVRRLMTSLRNSITRPSFLFNNSMIPKIKEVTDRLNELTTRRTSLGLGEIISQASSSKGMKPRLQPTSVMDEAVKYVGRQNEMREMLGLLKSSNNSDGVSVLSIVGMGGLGKTTLAQLVYNDATIDESFDLKAWVCVSEDFDAANITNIILKSIDNHSHDEKDLNLLQVRLKEKLSGKRFLLVLDDIWNDSYSDWSILRSPFRAGTKIIVTTRLGNVSSMVAPVKAFLLDKLSHGDCLSIFTQHALKAINFDGHLQFKEVGENIVRKCDGLPLAAKAIGSLLNTVKDHAAWERIHESEIWDLPESQCGIVPALRLSYHHLPSHLKQCFAYCSILPKDYEFEEEEIILLWGAEGFLQQKAKRQIKDVGKQYFQDLVSRSFFQISSKDNSRFVMHDLIIDLAQLVAGEICSKQEGDKQQRFSNRTRHSSYIVRQYDTVKKFGAFDEAISLRTFLPFKMKSVYNDCYLTNSVVVDLFPRLRCLRVLSLCGYQITELRENIFENLKHLRYLNFSLTQIKWLPDTLSTLYHLETLKLRDCEDLERFPSKMESLVNLHYLDIRGAYKIKRMPFGIGTLTNLEVLSDFIIGEGEGNYIGELKILSNLSGDFCLRGLENVNSQDVGEAKLNEKPGITALELRWSTDYKKATRKKEVEERVLESLQPQKKLEKLVIQNYGGAKFSSWIADSSFKNMSSLKLQNCKYCQFLPSIGKLPLLKDLSVVDLDGIHKIGIELFGENQSKAFASLETLCFERLPNWEEWDTCEGDEQASKFPCLRKLSIAFCPRLLGRLPTRLQSLHNLEIRGCGRLVVSISSFPLLRELSVEGCEALVDECSSSTPAVAEEVTSFQIVTLSNISKFSITTERFRNSEHFTIRNWKELASFSENGLGLVGHRFIRISNFPQLVSFETETERLQVDKILPGLEYLEIRECERLKRLPKVLYAFTFLTEIRIEECPGLVSFAESNFPPAIKKLVIRQCKNLQCLIVEKENNKKSLISNTCHLEHLEIWNCESLICLSSRVDICSGLRHLDIHSCSKLSSLFLNAKLPIQLKHLEIELCPMLECIAQDFHETTDLESIQIAEAPNIKSLLQGLNKLSHPQEIEIWDCPDLVSFEESGLPWTTTNLRVLSIEDCSNFGALPKCINNFTSLHELKVRNCSTEISFPEEGFPTNLIELEISYAPKIYSSLVEWGLNRLTSLQQLTIEGCSNVVSFPEQGIGMTLPPSLTRINIRYFENLEFMSSEGFQHLTSLQNLYISNCPKLTSLPEKDVLLSLGGLWIRNCPLLEEGCIRGKGPEWSKIAHIPRVQINRTRVIPRVLD